MEKLVGVIVAVFMIVGTVFAVLFFTAIVAALIAFVPTTVIYLVVHFGLGYNSGFWFIYCWVFIISYIVGIALNRVKAIFG